MKSLRDSQPFFGCASAPLDVQRYVDGRLHVPPDDPVVVGGTAVVGLAVVAGVAVVPPPVQGIHWEYQELEKVQQDPDTHVVDPVHPSPPP